MKKTLIIVMLMTVALSSTACSWVGRTAGKVQAKVERGADDMQSGYKEGYHEEKAKPEQGQKDKQNHQ